MKTVNDIITRDIEKPLEHWLFKKKVLILYGARQVGKTTVAQSLLKRFGKPEDYYNCDLLSVREILEKQDPQLLREYTKQSALFVLDEAQQVRDIGKALKIFHDAYPEVQIIATGSSSFDLANKLNEPLTGRSIEFILYPFSLHELSQRRSHFDLLAGLERSMIYGGYPDVALADSADDGQKLLSMIASSYLYKDILMFENLRKPALLLDLLKLLALQLGSEVSVHEIAVKLNTGTTTIERYVDLLEKAFVIFRLRSFSRNLRNEIGKKYKVYFYDIGVRNILIERMTGFDRRDDIGALWENFCIIERLKYNQRHSHARNIYFWRTHGGGHGGKEIDYIEEYDGELHGYEFKWGSAKYKEPDEFLSTYPKSSIHVIRKDNWLDFLMK
jgi:hypothetical protein